MAKQAGKIKIERTLGRLVFYKMNGEYYARTKSSLSGKRVKKDPKFRRTMLNAGLMGRASKIGSVVYKALPVEFRKFWMYRAFTGEAMKMLKGGMMEDEVRERLMEVYVKKEPATQKHESLKGKIKPVIAIINKSDVLYFVRNDGLIAKCGIYATPTPKPPWECSVGSILYLNHKFRYRLKQSHTF